MQSGDEFEGHAHIECWRGTPDEFLTILQVLADSADSADVVAEVRWKDGTKSRASGLGAIGTQLVTVPKSRSITARLAHAHLSDKSCVHAQQAIPGLSIEVSGPDHDVVSAATQSAFASAMIGYVDRLGTWRAPALAVSTAGIPASVMLLLPEPETPGLQVAGIVGLLAWLAFSFLVIWPYLLAAHPFVLVGSVERAKTFEVARKLVSRSKRRGRVWALGTVAGVVLVGLLSNGLYDGVLAALEAVRSLIFE